MLRRPLPAKVQTANDEGDKEQRCDQGDSRPLRQTQMKLSLLWRDICGPPVKDDEIETPTSRGKSDKQGKPK
jgi:hypothetical protein